MTISDINENFLTEGPGLSSPASRGCQAQLGAASSPRRSHFGVLTPSPHSTPGLGGMSGYSGLMPGWTVTARQPE